MKDLKLATFGFDFECSYANHTSTSNTDYVRLMNYCMKIVPYAQLPETDTILQQDSL